MFVSDDDDTESDASATDMSSFFEDPMAGVCVQAQYISTTRLIDTPLDFSTDAINTRANYKRSTKARSTYETRANVGDCDDVDCSSECSSDIVMHSLFEDQPTGADSLAEKCMDVHEGSLENHSVKSIGSDEDDNSNTTQAEEADEQSFWDIDVDYDAIEEPDQELSNHNLERSSQYNTYHYIPKIYTKGCDYIDNCDDGYGDDEFVVTPFSRLATGIGYRFPKQMPNDIEQLMTFWENDFQVGQEIYPKMSSWGKLGIINAMKKLPNDYEEYCIYEKLVKKWLSCGKKEAVWYKRYWGLGLTQVLNYPKRRLKHYPVDHEKNVINNCSLPKKQKFTSHLK